MGNAVLLPQAGRISEFVTDPTTGVWLNGTCGETALAVAIAAISHVAVSQDTMLAIYHDMRNRGLASASGASTLAGLAEEARAQGATVAVEVDYAEPLLYDWHTLLLNVAGTEPIVLQIANGQALRDVETGTSDEAGLRYHFICIVGKQDDGYICADGDSPDVASRFAIYSYATLQAALPCGVLVLAMEAQKTMTIDEFIAANPVVGPKIAGPYVVGDGAQEVLCQNGKLLQKADGSIVGGVCGQQLADTQKALADAQAATALAMQNLAGVTAERDALHAQVGGVDPETRKAMALLSAVRAAISAA